MHTLYDDPHGKLGHCVPDTSRSFDRDTGFDDRQNDSAEVEGHPGLTAILHALPRLAKPVLAKFLPNRGTLSMGIAILVVFATTQQVKLDSS